MNLIGRLFGARRHERPAPTAADVAAIDVDRMIATARERGDRRDKAEVLAALLVGAEVTADRHHDAGLRLRAAAAALAVRDRLVAQVGEDEAVRLLAASDGPVDEEGRTRDGRRA
jgi:hypothetical protein